VTGFTFRKLDHVALAVRSMEAACRLFVDVLGAEFIGGGDNPELQVRAVQLRLPPGTKIELLQPLVEGSYLDRYLEAKGEGFHHLTVYVDDVAAAVDSLVGAGYDVVDTDLSRSSWQETFVRPSSGFGALIQVARPGVPWESPIEGITLNDVLAGRVQVLANVLTLKETGEELRPRASL
jgi:methylmalonyl-CoA/ethylmalonyl-CoA epimerase